MKVIVAGGRDFYDYNVLNKVLAKEINTLEDCLICGDARGADSLASMWANRHEMCSFHYPALWDKYGKSAGFIRNAEMADEADSLIAFWDGKSKGTAHMIKTMKIKKKPYKVFNYQGELINA